MTTPTPRTDAAWADVNTNMLDHARQLERELAQRDTLIKRILDYPYLPQNLATIIRKEMDK